MTDKPVIDVQALLKAQESPAPVLPHSHQPPPSGPPAGTPEALTTELGSAGPPPLVTQRVRAETQVVRDLRDNSVVGMYERKKTTYVQGGGAFVTDDENPRVKLADGKVVNGLEQVQHGCPYYNRKRPKRFCGLIDSPCICTRCGIGLCRSHIWQPIFTDKFYCGRCLRQVLLAGALRAFGSAMLFVVCCLVGTIKWLVDSFRNPQ